MKPTGKKHAQFPQSKKKVSNEDSCRTCIHEVQQETCRRITALILILRKKFLNIQCFINKYIAIGTFL